MTLLGGIAKKNLFQKSHSADASRPVQPGPTCGAWMVTPAVVVSNTCSYWPAYRLTSVDVPAKWPRAGQTGGDIADIWNSDESQDL